MATKTKQSTPILYKPFGSPTSANAGKATIATASDAKAVDILGPDGNVISGTRRDNVPHTPEPGAIPGPYNQNWWAGSPNDIPPGSVIRVTNADGSYSYASLKNPYQGLRGSVDPGEGDSFQNAATLPVNTHSEGGAGIPPGFAPGQIGQYGVFPGYIGGMFPTAQLGSYNPITAAPYQFTDPMKFAKEFGAFNRQEIGKNFNQAQDLALKELNTELSSLQNFVPAASALKRQETSLDNQFNQAQRTNQVNQALPGVAQDLASQADRARAYAAGRIPDAVQNQAYEVGIRSAAADSAAAGGFGAASSVARKASDLLSATQRIQLSKYGDQLLSGNINQKAGLYLAPTEYSNAGTQVNVNPSLSSSQLTNSNLNAINGLTTITPTTGLQSTTQQNQFTTGLEQQTRQFNAANQLNLSEFNAGQQNQFALGLFGYQAGYANSVAGAQQTDINTQFGLQQQQLYQQLLQQYMQQSQEAGLISSLFSGGLNLFGSGGLSNLTNYGSGLKASAGGNVGPFADPNKYSGAMKGEGIGSSLGGLGAGISSLVDSGSALAAFGL